MRNWWPSWKPTEEMMERDPHLYTDFEEGGKWENGQPGGPSNPLGARALYLFDATGRDTYLRIHGSPYPTSIGGRASLGCVRMVMAHINDLYPQVSRLCDDTMRAVIGGDRVFINWDHEGPSFLVALDTKSGKEAWRQSRAGRLESYTTPILYPDATEPEATRSRAVSSPSLRLAGIVSLISATGRVGIRW